MIHNQTYAFMAAAAYDERRGSDGDDHVMAIETYLGTPNGGEWSKDNRPAWTNADGAPVFDPATCMQADVWSTAAIRHRPSHPNHRTHR